MRENKGDAINDLQHQKIKEVIIAGESWGRRQICISIKEQ